MKYEYFDMMKEMYKYNIIIVCKKKRKEKLVIIMIPVHVSK